MKSKKIINTHKLFLGRDICLVIVFLLVHIFQIFGQCIPPRTLTSENKTVCFNSTESVSFDVSNHLNGATINWYNHETKNRYSNNNGETSTSFDSQQLGAAFSTNTVTGKIYAVDVSQTVDGCESDIISVYIIQQPRITKPETAPTISSTDLCMSATAKFESIVPEELTIEPTNTPADANPITLRTAIGWNEYFKGTNVRNGLYFTPVITVVGKSETRPEIESNENEENTKNFPSKTSYRREFFVEDIQGYNVFTKACPTDYSDEIEVTIWPKPSSSGYVGIINPEVSLESILNNLNNLPKGEIPTEGLGLPFFTTACVDQDVELEYLPAEKNPLKATDNGQTSLYSWTKSGPDGPDEDIFDPPLNNPYRVHLSAEGNFSYFGKLVRQNPGGPRCFETTNPATIQVFDLRILVQPVDKYLCEGKKGYLSVLNLAPVSGIDVSKITGISLINYQWEVNKKDNELGSDFENDNTGNAGTFLSDATDTLFFDDPSTDLNGYKYRVKISTIDKQCTITSKIATLKVTESPKFETVLADTSIVCGSDISFSVSATSGSGSLNYSWEEKLDTINGFNFKSTGEQLHLSDLSPDNTGNMYKIIVSDELSCSIEASTVLFVFDEPVITTQPVSITSCETNDAKFSVVASGVNPLHYEWRDGDINLGVDSSIYTIEKTSLADDGRDFYVIVTDSTSCTATSVSAELAIITSPIITKQPESAAFCPGESLNLSIETESSDLSFIWQESIGTAPFVDIPESTSSTLIIDNLTLEQSGNRYRALISDNLCTGFSDIVTLVFSTTPVIDSFSQDVGCVGDNTTLTIDVSGSGPFNYTWMVDPNIGEFGVTTGNTNSLSLITVSEQQNGYKYQVSVSDDNSCVSLSEILTLQARVPPIMSAIANPPTICSGSITNIQCTSTNNTPEIKFQWIVNSPPEVTGWADQNESVYSPIAQTLISSLPGNKKVIYSITPFNGLCPGNGKDITVEVIPVSNVVVPTNAKQEICTGDELKIELSNSNNSNLTKYKWTVMSPPTITGWADQEIATFDPIQQVLTNSDSSDQIITYNIVPIENGCDGLTDTVSIVVQSLVFITKHPEGSSLCSRDTFNLDVVAYGSEPISYQWYRDDKVINNATNAYYEYSPVSLADNNAIFRVEVRNLCDLKSSDNSILNVGKIGKFTNEKITADNYSPEYGSLVTFNYEGVDMPLEWDFGDNTQKSNFKNPTHNYFSVGVKTVTLLGFQDPQCTRKTTFPIDVTGININPITNNITENQELQFFPMPATDKITAQFTYLPKAIYITTLEGIIVQENKYFSSNSVTLNISSLPTGVYIITVETDEGILHSKFIKQQ